MTKINEKVYCAYDTLNPPIDRTTGEEIHVCGYYGTVFCTNCSSRYNGEKIKKYMEKNPRIEH
mgnify:FL=1